MKQTRSHRRKFLAAAMTGLIAVPLARAQSAGKSAKAKLTGLVPANTPPSDGYTPGILAEGEKLIFVSGRGPQDRTADMETQVRQTLQAIADVLKEAGASMENVVILRGYFLNVTRDLPAYRKVRKEFFSKPYPASTSIGVSALAVAGLQLEIEAVAVI